MKIAGGERRRKKREKRARARNSLGTEGARAQKVELRKTKRNKEIERRKERALSFAFPLSSSFLSSLSFSLPPARGISESPRGRTRSQSLRDSRTRSTSKLKHTNKRHHATKEGRQETSQEDCQEGRSLWQEEEDQGRDLQDLHLQGVEAGSP